jgi:hypothetical protein
MIEWNELRDKNNKAGSLAVSAGSIAVAEHSWDEVVLIVRGRREVVPSWGSLVQLVLHGSAVRGKKILVIIFPLAKNPSHNKNVVYIPAES